MENNIVNNNKQLEEEKMPAMMLNQEGSSRELMKVFENEHNNILELFSKVNKGRSKKMKYFNELIILLLAHSDSEEIALFQNTAITSNIQRGKRQIAAQHELIRRQVQFILNTYEDDDMWGARFDVLEMLCNQHINQESDIIMDTMYNDTEDIDINKIKSVYLKNLSKKFDEITNKVESGFVLRETDISEYSDLLKAVSK